MDRLVDQKTAYAQGPSYDDLPGEVAERAKHFILDTVECALGAVGNTPVHEASLGRYKLATEARGTVPMAGGGGATLERWPEIPDS